MKAVSGVFGILAALFAVLGLFCGGIVTMLGISGLDHTDSIRPEIMHDAAGSSISCLIFLIPIIAIAALIGGVISFGKPRVGAIIQLSAFIGIFIAYVIAALRSAAFQDAVGGFTATAMTFAFGGFLPMLFSGLGAFFGFRVAKQETTPVNKQETPPVL
jgi:hypothetical protein